MTGSLSLTEVAAFKQELLSLLEQLKAEVSDELRQQIKPHIEGVKVHHHGDDAEASIELMLNVEVLAMHDEEIAQCLSALKRIETGDFGFCIDCDEEVELSRLRACPTAARCIRCQSIHESVLSKTA